MGISASLVIALQPLEMLCFFDNPITDARTELAFLATLENEIESVSIFVCSGTIIHSFIKIIWINNAWFLSSNVLFEEVIQIDQKGVDNYI